MISHIEVLQVTYDARVVANPIIIRVEAQPFGCQREDELRLIYHFPHFRGTRRSDGSIAPSLVIVTSSNRNEGDFLHASASLSAEMVASLSSEGMMHMFFHRSCHLAVVSGKHIA